MKRNWAEDSKTIIKQVASIFDFPKDHHFNVKYFNANRIFCFFLKISIYCEGTRFTEEKHKASIEFAKSKGLPQLKHHLLPRVKGFSLLMQSGKNKSI